MLNRSFKRTALTTLLGFVTAGLMVASLSVHSQTASDSSKADAKSSQMSNKSGAASSGASGASDSSGSGAKVSSADRNMMRSIAQTNLAEIAMGKLALSKSQNDDVKTFAQKMIDDHTTALNDLQQLAQSKGVTLPTTPDGKHQAAAKKLGALSGEKFDTAYKTQAGVKDHREAHNILQRAATKAKDPDLKAYITKTSAAVDTHLQTAQQMKGGNKSTSMGSSSGSASKSGSDVNSGSGSNAKSGASSGTGSGK